MCSEPGGHQLRCVKIEVRWVDAKGMLLAGPTTGFRLQPNQLQRSEGDILMEPIDNPAAVASRQTPGPLLPSP